MNVGNDQLCIPHQLCKTQAQDRGAWRKRVVYDVRPGETPSESGESDGKPDGKRKQKRFGRKEAYQVHATRMVAAAKMVAGKAKASPKKKGRRRQATGVHPGPDGKVQCQRAQRARSDGTRSGHTQHTIPELTASRQETGRRPGGSSRAHTANVLSTSRLG